MAPMESEFERPHVVHAKPVPGRTRQSVKPKSRTGARQSARRIGDLASPRSRRTEGHPKPVTVLLNAHARRSWRARAVEKGARHGGDLTADMALDGRALLCARPICPLI